MRLINRFLMAAATVACLGILGPASSQDSFKVTEDLSKSSFVVSEFDDLLYKPAPPNPLFKERPRLDDSIRVPQDIPPKETGPVETRLELAALGNFRDRRNAGTPTPAPVYSAPPVGMVRQCDPVTGVCRLVPANQNPPQVVAQTVCGPCPCTCAECICNKSPVTPAYSSGDYPYINPVKPFVPTPVRGQVVCGPNGCSVNSGYSYSSDGTPIRRRRAILPRNRY